MKNTFYYSSDNKVFSSKVEALKYRASSHLGISLYYNDTSYDKVNWLQEPNLSLDQLYKQQAEKIRDEHDYVILMYSGGIDSSNILEAFYYNNIKIDKIVCVGAFSQDSYKGSDENKNGEIYNSSYPILKRLNLLSITEFIDYSKIILNNPNSLSITKYESNWINDIGAWFSPHIWFWRDVEKYVVPDNLFGKDVALIWGIDKPIISKIGDRLAFRFNDQAVMGYGNTFDDNNNYINKIFFYWDYNSPDILLKQLHILKNNYLAGKGLYDFEPAIYNLRNPILYKSPKSPSTIFSLRDKFLTKHKDAYITKIYNAGINNIRSSGVSISDFDTIKSKPYFIT